MMRRFGPLETSNARTGSRPSSNAKPGNWATNSFPWRPNLLRKEPTQKECSSSKVSSPPSFPTRICSADRVSFSGRYGVFLAKTDRALRQRLAGRHDSCSGGVVPTRPGDVPAGVRLGQLRNVAHGGACCGSVDHVDDCYRVANGP